MSSPKGRKATLWQQKSTHRPCLFALPDYRRAVELLDAITGINLREAPVVIAEMGLQMDRFATEGHLASWVGL